MKIWTLTTNFRDDTGTWVKHTLEEAEAQARSEIEQVLADFNVSIEDTKNMTTDELVAEWNDTDGYFFEYWIVEHDLRHHPAVREAVATLYVCQERLHMNNYEGEEAPFLQDVEHALSLLV